MNFGGKKSKATEEAVNTTQNDATSKKSKKRKKDGLGVYFNESVFETVAVDLEANVPCIADIDGEKKYIALLLEVKDIGGIDKKSKNDPSKGQIIENIRSGRIKTYNTEATLDDDVLILIPDLETIDSMDEFQLLVDAPYTVCTIDETGKITVEDVTTTFNEIRDIIAEDKNVADSLGISGENADVDEADDTVENESDTNQVVQDENMTAGVQAEESNVASTVSNAENTENIAMEEPDNVQPVMMEEPDEGQPLEDFSEQDIMGDGDSFGYDDDDDFTPDMSQFMDNQQPSGDMGYADDSVQEQPQEQVIQEPEGVEQTEEMVDDFIFQ